MPKTHSNLASPSKAHGSHNQQTNNITNQAVHPQHNPYRRPSAPINNHNARTSNLHLSRQLQQQQVCDPIEDDDFGDLQLTQEELDDFDDDTIAAAAAAESDFEDDDDDDGFGDIDDLTLSREDLDASTSTATPTTTMTTTSRPTTVRAHPHTTPSSRTPTSNINTTTIPPDGPDGQINSQQSFTAFLDRLKSGQERTYTRTATGGYTHNNLVRIPDQFIFTPAPPPRRTRLEYTSVQRQFLLEIFPDIATAPVRSESMMSNVILTEREDSARRYNELALEMQQHLSTPQSREGRPATPRHSFPAGGGGHQAVSYQEKTYSGISKPVSMDDYELLDMCSAHWLNPQGMPSHDIPLRLGHPVILLRDVQLSLGRILTGTRCIITYLGDSFIKVEVALGPHKGQVITLSRMLFNSPNKRDIGIMWTRLQYPIKHAFALSLSDAVGWSFPGKVGLDLQSHVSKSRQLYFLMACCADFKGLRVYVEDGRIPGQPGMYTCNPI